MKTADSSAPHDSGQIRIQLRYQERQSKKSLDVADFDFLKMIGKGTFGRVFQVRKKDTRRIYAMKVLSKKEVIDKKEVQHTIGERNILQQSSKCPFLLGLKFSFQSPGELFLVMDYKSGGVSPFSLQVLLMKVNTNRLIEVMIHRSSSIICKRKVDLQKRGHGFTPPR